MNKDCRCIVADSLVYAAYNFKYFIDTQRPGSVKRYAPVDGKFISSGDVRSSPVYIKSSSILEPAEVSLEHPDGAICPCLVLLRAIAGDCSGGNSTEPMSAEIVDVLAQIGPIKGDNVADAINTFLDRTKGRLSGRFIPDWMEP